MRKEEQAILSYFTHKSEDTGKKLDHTIVDFDDATLSTIQEKYHVSIDVNNKSNVLNQLLSHGYIQYLAKLGIEEYCGMKITPKGSDVIKEIKEKEEQLKNRNFLKKLSDCTENYKGLATFTGIMIAIITLVYNMGRLSNG